MWKRRNPWAFLDTDCTIGWRRINVPLIVRQFLGGYFVIRRSRHAVTVLLAALAIPAAIVAAAPSAVASPAAVDCIQNPTPDSNITGASFLGTNVNIRTGPFTSCTAIGEGQPTNGVTVHCRRLNSNNVLWDYLTDRSTGKTGWSIDSLVGYPRTPIGCGPN